MHPILKLLAPVREERCRILVGDNRELLRTLPAKSIQTCVTSPPYFGLRDYGVEGQLGLEATPDEFCAALVAVFREVRRVLKDDGTVWLNLGDSYARPTAKGGSGPSGKNRAYYGDNYGDAGGAGVPTGLKDKDLIGIPWRVAFALQADGWYLRQDIIWHKPNPMPESVKDRCTKAHEYIFLLTKSPKYFFDSEAMREPAVYGEQHAKKATSWGANRKHPNKANTANYAFIGDNSTCYKDENGAYMKNKRSVWTVATKPYKGAHFATFPPDLIRPCILAGSRPGDTVLDPFGGSGTTGQVALEEDRRAVLLELNPTYADLARERTSKISR
jgi:DNA modification methylase